MKSVVNRCLTELRQLGLYPKLEGCAPWTPRDAVFLFWHGGHLVIGLASS